MENNQSQLSTHDVIALYGSVPLYFGHYYKYSFTFSGAAEDGAIVSITIGGDHNDIYRLEVNAHDIMYFSDEQHYSASVVKDGIEIYRYYNW
jgi:hypothetical protein